MKQAGLLALLILCLPLLIACGTIYNATDASSIIGMETTSATSQSSEMEQYQSEQESEIQSEESDFVKIKITVGDTTLSAIPEENSSAEAFLALLQEQPITVQMSDYGGMEKVGALGNSLPRNDTQISVDAGDVILYQGNQITIYYDTNSWTFTKLAVIEDATKKNLLEILGTGDVTVMFSLAE